MTESYPDFPTEGKITLYPAEQVPEISDSYEYEVSANVDNVHKVIVRFRRYIIGSCNPIMYALDYIQSQHPDANITFNYIKEYDNVRDY